MTTKKKTTNQKLLSSAGFHFIKDELCVEVACPDPTSTFSCGKTREPHLFFPYARANVCFIQLERLLCLLLTIHHRDEMQPVTSVCGKRNQFTPLVRAQNGTNDGGKKKTKTKQKKPQIRNSLAAAKASSPLHPPRFNSSHRRRDGPEQAATFILDVGMIVMMLGENVSVAFRASVANAGTAALAAEKPRNIKRSQQNFQMDFVLMASLYAKLKGG